MRQEKRLLSIAEIRDDAKRWTDRTYLPAKQNGWLTCGLHQNDGASFTEYNAAEYLAGYASVPPIVHLRAGETMRRYFEPGLDDGKTFVFWGRNYKTGGIPGPERSLTWVNQPEKMYRSKEGTTYREGQARYGNVVYEYRPKFADGSYKEGVVAETESQLTFEFYTPYIIAATPSNDSPWGIYDAGCRNGLVLHGQADCRVSVSVDQGGSWHDAMFRDGLDLTDYVKGHRQYLLRLDALPTALKDYRLLIRTVCQGNAALFPWLRDQGTTVEFQSTQRAVLSAKPNIDQARAHITAGAFNSPTVTLRLSTPRGEPPEAVYAAAHIASGNPPDTNVTYWIEYSVDHGKTWQTIVRNWKVQRRGEEPGDFWSQSFCYGSSDIITTNTSILIRFSNSGRKNILRAEAHLVYRTGPDANTRVTFNWSDDRGQHADSHVFALGTNNAPWKLATGMNTKTRWVSLPLKSGGRFAAYGKVPFVMTMSSK